MLLSNRLAPLGVCFVESFDKIESEDFSIVLFLSCMCDKADDAIASLRLIIYTNSLMIIP